MCAQKSPEELKKIFEKYAAREGDPDQLSKEELKLLVQTEFPSLLKVSAGPIAEEALGKWSGHSWARKGHEVQGAGILGTGPMPAALDGDHLITCFPPLLHPGAAVVSWSNQGLSTKTGLQIDKQTCSGLQPLRHALRPIEI